MGSGLNRWNDKSLQLVTCANGVSGLICQHATTDSQTVWSLHDAIAESIQNYRRLETSNKVSTAKSNMEMTMINLTVPQSVIDRIDFLRKNFELCTARYSFRQVFCKEMNVPFILASKASPRFAILIALLLAQRFFFGQIPCSSETLTMSHYHAG